MKLEIEHYGWKVSYFKILMAYNIVQIILHKNIEVIKSNSIRRKIYQIF